MRVWHFKGSTDWAGQRARLREIWSAMQPGDVVAEHTIDGRTVQYRVIADCNGAHGVALKFRSEDALRFGGSDV